MERSLPDTDTMYQALLDKDSQYEGIFVVAVKTTGVFCRPTCTARKPKRENVEFFPTTRDAILHGYRPCKICNPLGKDGEVPEWLLPLLKEVQQNPAEQYRDADLQSRGLEPNRVRRWFKRHHGMTFQAYLRALRISQAFGRVKHGDKIIHTAYESGYESLSGFAESFRKQVGASPKNSTSGEVINITRMLTPLGPMLAGAVEEGICLLDFVDRRMLETQLKRLQVQFHATLLPGVSAYFDQLHKELDEYFRGERSEFTVPVVLRGTDFQLEVWRALQTIPYGETRSYGQQAKVLGRPKAVRAVARANGDNKISILIPCHRVIGADGRLVGYGGGLWRKQFLLDLEKRGNRLFLIQQN